MGNAISSGTKYCTSFVIGKAKYILQLEDNLEALESDVQLLEARRLDLENKIKLEERKGLQRLHEVVVWFLRVEAIQSQARDLLDAKTVEVERLSMCGYCSNDLILTYRYGKKVSESLEKVKGYLSSKTFEVVTWEGLPPDMEEGTSQSTTDMPSDTEEDPSQSTTGGPPSDIEEDPSQSTVGGPPSDIEEKPSRPTTGGPPSDLEEDPSLTGLHFGIEKDCSQSTTGLSSDIDEDPSQSTIGLPSEIEDDSSQFTTSLSPPDIMEEPSQSTTALSPDIEEEPSQPTVSSDTMLEATWKHLMEDNVGILGLYGMGGIGKTTLLLQIKERFLEKRNEFDEVIDLVVSQNLHIGRIQKVIGKRLGLYDSEWKQKIEEEKATDIKKVLLTRKRFVILLDDICEKVELEEIGIPLPSTQNRSKVVYTTRLRKICERMGPDDMEVKCLSPENAWKVFQHRVGANTLASDPEIFKLAKIVCDKCKGIPLALIIVGKTMARAMTVHKWQHAIEILNSNSAKYTTEVEEEVFKILKVSYDLLQNEGIRQCFQHYALFPENNMINIESLVECWICEGLVDGGGKKEEAVNHGYAIIGILLDTGLLIDLEHMRKVIMHDVIRQMALWIVSNFGEEKEIFLVKVNAGLHQMPEVENWNAVRRMSVGNNQIETISGIPYCPNLTTLFLRKNKLVSISGDSFLSMPKLVVLDLSYNKHLSKLPEEVSKLVNLRYLDLSGTGLQELPMGLSELIQLRYLCLNYMEKLESISGISSLLNLERLQVIFSTPLSLASIKDIELLKNLRFLSVTITELSILECFLSIPRLASCTQDLCLHLGECEVKDLSLAATAASLRTLGIEGGSILHLMDDMRHGCRSTCARTTSFENLSIVALSDVSGIQDLTWLLFAPSLTDLLAEALPEVREIISREKVSGIVNEGSSIVIPFQKLYKLHLNDMEELTSIYWEPLIFPALTSIKIDDCPKLKKLPLNKESSKGNRLCLESDDKEWLDGIEWEDEETKDRLVH